VALILVGVGWCSSPGFSGEELFYRNDFSCFYSTNEQQIKKKIALSLNYMIFCKQLLKPKKISLFDCSLQTGKTKLQVLR